MNLKAFLSGLMLACMSILIVSCDKDSDKREEVNQALALKAIKGKYKGTLKISDVKTQRVLFTFDRHTQSSDDALYMELPIDGIAAQIQDDALAQRIRKSFRLYAKGKYIFTKEDKGSLHFSLHPEQIYKFQNQILSNDFSVEFMQNYGGEASIQDNYIQTRIVISKLWIDGQLYKDFKPVLYYFEGTKE